MREPLNGYKKTRLSQPVREAGFQAEGQQCRSPSIFKHERRIGMKRPSDFIPDRFRQALYVTLVRKVAGSTVAGYSGSVACKGAEYGCLRLPQSLHTNVFLSSRTAWRVVCRQRVQYRFSWLWFTHTAITSLLCLLKFTPTEHSSTPAGRFNRYGAPFQKKQ
jgi:hypothetical protein